MLNHNSYPSDKCTFELLSAYLDGEVTAEQRKEVQVLLAENPSAQQLYQRLLILRQEIQSLPTPQSQYTASDLSQSVFARVDRENRQQRKRWLWGGSAIAALVVATMGSVFSDSNSPTWQMAQQNESLVIALNEPLIQLPSENQNSQESLMIPLSESLVHLK